MAERQRFATNRLSPTNPMQFSPTVQGRQGDTSRTNQMQGIAKQLLQFSDSFAGAFKAGAQVSEQEYIKQQKLEQSIREEQATTDALRGKFIAMQRGLLPQAVLDAESESFNEGYKTQIYTDKIKTDNEYIKSTSSNLADRMYAQWSTATKAKRQKGQTYVPLAEYASIFIQQERDRLLSGYENDPIAWKVFTDKGGLDFNPLQESLAKHMGEEAEKIRSTTLAQRVIREHKNNVYQSYQDYEAVDGIIGLNIEGVDFYTKEERQNAFLQDIENRLKIVETLDDPVLKSLDFTFKGGASDGIGFKNSQYKSYSENSQTIQQRYYKLVEAVGAKREQLEKEATKNNKTPDNKEEEQLQIGAKKELLSLYGRLLKAKTRAEVLAIDAVLNSDGLRHRTRKGTGTGAGITHRSVLDKLQEIMQSKTLNPDPLEPTPEQAQKMQKLLTQIIDTKGKAKVGKIKPETVDGLDKSIQEFAALKGGEELYKEMVDLRDNKKEYDDKTDREVAEKLELTNQQERGERLKRILNSIQMYERGETPYNTQAIRSITASLAAESHEDFRETKKYWTNIVKALNTKDKLTLLEEFGFEAVDSATDLVSNPDTTVDDLDFEINRLKNLSAINWEDKEKALKLLYDRRFKLKEKNTTDKELKKKIAFRERIFNNSEDKTELETLRTEAGNKGYGDLQEEVQGYINILNTREYNDEVYGQRLVENREYNKELYKKRRDEVRNHKKILLNESRVYNNRIKELDRWFENLTFQERKKERREYQAKRDKIIEEKRIDIRNEKRAWQKFLRETYKTEDEVELTRKQLDQKNAFNAYIKLSEDLAVAVLNKDTDAVKKIRRKYLNATTQSLLSKSPAVDELFQEELKNANIELKIQQLGASADNTAFANRQTAKQSGDDFDIEVNTKLIEIDGLLKQDPPDIIGAESLLSSRHTLTTYDTEKKELITGNPALFKPGVLLRLQEDIRIAKHNHENKTTDRKAITDPVVYVSLTTGLSNFPTQNKNEKNKDFDVRAEEYYNTIYKALNDNYIDGKLTEGTHTRLKKDLDSLLMGGQEARLAKIKNNPKDPIQTFTKKLFTLVAKTDPMFWNLKGSATFFKLDSTRNQLYADMSEEFDMLVYDEFNTNKDYRENTDIRKVRTEELYDQVIGKQEYVNRLNEINDILNRGGKTKEDEGIIVEVGGEESDPEKVIEGSIKKLSTITSDQPAGNR